MLLLPLGSSAGYKVQGVDKSRGIKTSAFSFPELPPLPDHLFYLVTPSGSDGIYFKDAIGDLLDMSTWFTAVFAVSENGQPHMHYIIALPSSCQEWLSKHPTIFRSGRKIPHVTYSRDTGEGCSLSFSQITNVDGLREYLEGPKNNARFVVLLDPSPRTVWKPLPDNRQWKEQGRPRKNTSNYRVTSSKEVRLTITLPTYTSLSGVLVNLVVSSIQKGKQGICSVDRNLRGHFDSS